MTQEITAGHRATIRDIARVAGLAIGEAWQESDALRLVEVLATAFQQVTKERDRLAAKNAKLRKVAEAADRFLLAMGSYEIQRDEYDEDSTALALMLSLEAIGFKGLALTQWLEKRG